MKVITLRGELLVLWEDLNRNDAVARDKNGDTRPKRYGPANLTGPQLQQRLQDLPDSATLAEVQAVAGKVPEVDLHLVCDECEQEVEQLLHLGHGLLHVDRPEKGFDLCARCVLKAFVLWETKS